MAENEGFFLSVPTLSTNFSSSSSLHMSRRLAYIDLAACYSDVKVVKMRAIIVCVDYKERNEWKLSLNPTSFCGGGIESKEIFNN